jgi:choline dehydrogenase-like flavoprotein
MEIIKTRKTYDAVIIGSGAGGGMSANILAENGLNVAIIEAGPFFDPAQNQYRSQLRPAWESPRRGASTPLRNFGDWDAAYGGWNIEGEPYTKEEGTDFWWFRSRMLGGRTNHWGRISLRFGPLDFKRNDIDGLGDNWPIGYDEIKPFYDRVDKMIGVFGSKEGIYNEPDGFFLPPPKPRLHEMYYIKGARKAGIPVIPSRLSILTKRLNSDRGVCFYCRQCNRACQIYADFSSGSCLIFPAQKGTGRVDLFVNAMARKVITNKEGKATGVSYINKENGTEQVINGKVIVMGASACSTARILLNSKSTQHPNGLGNSSGVMGRYLHDSTGADRMALIPDLMNRKTYNEDGVGGLHVYTPWWLNDAKLDFPRGYHFEIWGGLGHPSYGTGFNVSDLNSYIGGTVGGYGDKLRDDMKKFYGSTIGISMRGESVPQYDNYCSIDPNKVDQWGIPVLKFNYRWTEYEYKQAKHAQDMMEEVLTSAGGIMIGDKPGEDRGYGLTAPGQIIHEVGTTRMGDDPKRSVTNKWSQLHDCENVFIVDAGTFVSQADKNPTWTILALSMRASEYVVDQLKKQNI